LYAFLEDKNPDAARRAIVAIQAAVDRLRLFPESGRPLDSLPTQYREVLVHFGSGGYVVYYFADDRMIEVLSVRHFREDTPHRP
jgi:plasmid stabilization system protein ParE